MDTLDNGRPEIEIARLHRALGLRSGHAVHHQLLGLSDALFGDLPRFGALRDSVMYIVTIRFPGGKVMCINVLRFAEPGGRDNDADRAEHRCW